MLWTYAGPSQRDDLYGAALRLGSLVASSEFDATAGATCNALGNTCSAPVGLWLGCEVPVMPTERPVYLWKLKFESNVRFLADLVGLLRVS